MARFVRGESRSQGALLPALLDDYFREDNPAWFVDVFID